MSRLVLQILEKHMHHDAPATAKLWSPLRRPLLAFFARHPAAISSYFLHASRFCSQRQDYFWLLHDLALQPAGGPLLDALCASEPLWAALLDQIISEVPSDGSAPLPLQCFETLHFMSSVSAARPGWLRSSPALWPRILQLWEHPGREARAARLRTHGVRERAESAMLAQLVLSYVDATPSELPRILDLFTLFQHPVRVSGSRASASVAE